MNKIFKVDILTPYGKYLSTNAEYLSVLTPKGVDGILPGHAELITTVDICKLTIKIGNEQLDFAIGGGLMHIKEGTHVVLLLKSIERSDEIDLDRATQAKQRAEERLSSHSDEIDILRAKASLARALNRISVYERNNV